MKQIVMAENGGSDVLHLVDAKPKALEPGEIRIKTTAIGVNFIDIYQRRGLYPVSLPAVPGREGAGLVEEISEGVLGFAPGDRVAFLGDGSYSEFVDVPAAMIAPIPKGVSDEVAGAMFLKGLTVQMLVRQVYPLKSGDTALVYAAAGGVGTLLCQWANHIGATVIGVIGDESKRQPAHENGATHVINREAEPDIAGAVRKLTDGRGVNVVYDSVGEKTFLASLDALGLRGMMVTYGNASGPPPAISPLELSRRGSIMLARPSLFHFVTDGVGPMAEEMFSLVEKGVLTPRIAKTFPLEEAGAAQSLLESGGSIGSIILTP